MSTYLVGDIQGCLAPLQALLDEVRFNPKTDQLLCAGDLLNRGPDSLETMHFLMSLGGAVRSVLGNHDLHFLAIAFGNESEGIDAHLRPLLEAPDRDAICAWLRRCPLLIEDQAERYLLTHAGVPHIWSRQVTVSAARELEAVIQGDQADQYFAKIYGNKPHTWRDDLQGMKRLRAITNYFTRMRFINGAGRLNLKYSGDAKSLGGDYFPWYSRRHPSWDQYRFFFGHWAALNGITHQPQVIALDAGCVWGGCLRLCRLEDLRFFDYDCS